MNLRIVSISPSDLLWATPRRRNAALTLIASVRALSLARSLSLPSIRKPNYLWFVPSTPRLIRATVRRCSHMSASSM
jgi:hypothetical protein